MLRVNSAQKANKLSVEQAKNFSKDLSEIAQEKQKIRDKHTGYPGTENMLEIENQLTKISEEINSVLEAGAI